MKEITIEYRTEKQFCSCCETKLEKPQVSDPIEFTITKDYIEECGNWNELIDDETSELNECDLEAMTEDLVIDTVYGFNYLPELRVDVNRSEYKKVAEFIKSYVIQ